MSRTKAINEKCKDCTYDPCASGSWRSQTESCNVQSCALWAYRPLTIETINANRKAGKVVEQDIDAEMGA